MLKKIASNTIAQVLTKVATAIISIFLIKLLTNYLSIELYGLYNKIYNYLGIFAFLADLGLYTITIREINKDKKMAEKVVGNVMTIRTILGIIIIGLSIVIAYFLPGYDTVLALQGIAIVSIFTLLSLWNSSFMALMQSFMKIEFSLISTILGKILNIGLISFFIFVLFVGDRISSEALFIMILLAGLIGIALNTFLNFIYANKISKIRFRFDWYYIAYLLKTSLPYGLALFLSVVYFKIDIIILSILEPSEIADKVIALYSLPMKIIEVLMITGVFLLNSILPTLTEFYNNKKMISFSTMISNSFKILLALGISIVSLGLLFGENILLLVSNEDYVNTFVNSYSSYEAFAIVLFVLLFYFISSLFAYSLIASDNQKILLKINISLTIINIIGNIILIPKYSFIGAAVMTLISQIILFLVTYFVTYKIFKIQIDYIYIIKIILLGLGMYFLGGYIINNYSISYIFDLLVYGGLLFFLYISIVIFIFYGDKISKNRN